MGDSKNSQKREAPTNKHYLPALLPLVAALLFSACAPSHFIRPDTSSPSPDHGARERIYGPVADTGMQEADIDFADAFDTVTAADDTTWMATRKQPALPARNITVDSVGVAPFYVPAKTVRIALMQNVAKSVVYSVGTVTLHHHRLMQPLRFRGRILFEMKPGGRAVTVSVGNEVHEAATPCTLLSDNAYNYLEIGDTTYRGALIIVPGEAGKFTVVNYLDIEDYLRGVVPLELGIRPREEIEALKAQAVAARTYAYRCLIERRREPFDMVATMADQVYGGVAVEYRESDMAVKSTADLIMAYGDSIIQAYFHSTCGGITADVNEAWGKPSRPYLRSIQDYDLSGRAWCRASTYFSWEESWPWKQFSVIVLQYLQKLDPHTRFRGVVTGISVEERFACGRIKRATFTGSGWSYGCGADQIRYILRRGTAGNPILRSSNFSVTSKDQNVITLSGKGYGHGVGMCQMGAVGRAQAGQNFAEILKSYYTGISIVKATSGERAKR